MPVKSDDAGVGAHRCRPSRRGAALNDEAVGPVRTDLPRLPPPMHPKTPRILQLVTVDSTQAEAQRRAAAGERGPLWISAGQQTQGRGRSGRAWASPSGNLAATLLLRPQAPLAMLPQLSLVTGVAAIDAVAPFLARQPDAPPLRLKWPNDLLIGDAKLAGILIETSIIGVDTLAMIGIGINIAEAPPVSGRDVTRLADHSNTPPPPSALLQSLSNSMAHWLEIWSKGAGFTAIRTAWLARARPEGASITVNAGDGPVHGSFVGLDMDGALLLLEPSGHRRRFSWGDVSVLPTKN